MVETPDHGKKQFSVMEDTPVTEAGAPATEAQVGGRNLGDRRVYTNHGSRRYYKHPWYTYIGVGIIAFPFVIVLLYAIIDWLK